MFDCFEKPTALGGGWERVCLTVDGCRPITTETVKDHFSSVLRLVSEALAARDERFEKEAVQIYKLQQKEESLEERRRWERLSTDDESGRWQEPLPAACLLQALDLKIRQVCRSQLYIF